jgi:hypothetical protein
MMTKNFTAGRIFIFAIACTLASVAAAYGTEMRFHLVDRGIVSDVDWVPDSARFSFRSVVRGSFSEQVAFDLINQFRAQHGLYALQYSEEITVASRRWSTTMRERRIFQHASSAERGGAGENIAMNHVDDPEASARRAVQQWINSPPHRAFLLSRNITEAGVGGDGGYWTFRGRNALVQQPTTQTVDVSFRQQVIESEQQQQSQFRRGLFGRLIRVR